MKDVRVVRCVRYESFGDVRDVGEVRVVWIFIFDIVIEEETDPTIRPTCVHTVYCSEICAVSI